MQHFILVRTTTVLLVYIAPSLAVAGDVRYCSAIATYVIMDVEQALPFYITISIFSASTVDQLKPMSIADAEIPSACITQTASDSGTASTTCNFNAIRVYKDLESREC